MKGGKSFLFSRFLLSRFKILELYIYIYIYKYIYARERNILFDSNSLIASTEKEISKDTWITEREREREGISREARYNISVMLIRLSVAVVA